MPKSLLSGGILYTSSPRAGCELNMSSSAKIRGNMIMLGNSTQVNFIRFDAVVIENDDPLMKILVSPANDA